MSLLFKVKFTHINTNCLLMFITFTMFTYVNCDYLNPCFSVQECKDISSIVASSSSSSSRLTTSQSIKCSIHGKCFYDYTTFMLQEKKYPFITCVCDQGYVTVNDDDSVYCCYEQKLQAIAFVLEIIPGFGAGHLYLGNNILGGIKLSFFVVLITTMIVCSCYLRSILKKNANPHKDYKQIPNNNEPRSNKNENELTTNTIEIVLSCIPTICIIIILLWQFVDWILFGINYYTDGNNVKVKEW